MSWYYHWASGGQGFGKHTESVTGLTIKLLTKSSCIAHSHTVLGRWLRRGCPQNSRGMPHLQRAHASHACVCDESSVVCHDGHVHVPLILPLDTTDVALPAWHFFLQFFGLAYNHMAHMSCTDICHMPHVMPSTYMACTDTCHGDHACMHALRGWTCDIAPSLAVALPVTAEPYCCTCTGWVQPGTSPANQVLVLSGWKKPAGNVVCEGVFWQVAAKTTCKPG